jgi:hypothetical protein
MVEIEGDHLAEEPAWGATAAISLCARLTNGAIVREATVLVSKDFPRRVGAADLSDLL